MRDSNLYPLFLIIILSALFVIMLAIEGAWDLKMSLGGEKAYLEQVERLYYKMSRLLNNLESLYSANLTETEKCSQAAILTEDSGKFLGEILDLKRYATHDHLKAMYNFMQQAESAIWTASWRTRDFFCLGNQDEEYIQNVIAESRTWLLRLREELDQHQ